MGLNEDTVCARASREKWFEERDKAKQALDPAHRKQLVAIATGATIEQVEAAPTLETLIASNASKSKAVAGNVALRALERLEKCDDDELIQSSVADVALKYTGMAAKAGGWDAQAGTHQTVVNIGFLCPASHEDALGSVVIEQEGQDSGNG